MFEFRVDGFMAIFLIDKLVYRFGDPGSSIAIP